MGSDGCCGVCRHGATRSRVDQRIRYAKPCWPGIDTDVGYTPAYQMSSGGEQARPGQLAR